MSITHRLFYGTFKQSQINPFGDFDKLVLLASREDGLPDTQAFFLTGPNCASKALSGKQARAALLSYFLQNSFIEDTDAAGALAFLGGVK